MQKFLSTEMSLFKHSSQTIASSVSLLHTTHTGGMKKSNTALSISFIYVIFGVSFLKMQNKEQSL